jgi:inhibitor of cysteine peptidase
MIRVSRQAVAMLVVTLACATVVAAGCSSADSARLELTADDSGSTQQLAIDQEMKVALESNQTTGYRWAVDGDVPPQLAQVGEPTYSSESTLVGAGGQEVWTFKGAQTGSAQLKLKYWRSFEPTAQPAETFTVTVDVK